MGEVVIVPSKLRYKSAPSIDQELKVPMESKTNELDEYDRIASVNLAQLFDDERQRSTTFRPTFKVAPIYENAYTGTTEYIPFLNYLYYVDAERSLRSGIWKGYPQYYEFEFFRPDARDQHFRYITKSAYTYNWMYNLSIPFENNTTQQMYWTDGDKEINFVASDGIPFVINNVKFNGTNYISCTCIAEHNLQVGDYVNLNINYNGQTLFQVNTLGNGTLGSDSYVFNLYNIGYTGTTFANNKMAIFRKVLDISNSGETMSNYYVRMHKIITNPDDLVITKTGFEESPFASNKKFEFSSLTPNNISRISQKNASSTYTFTMNYDLDFNTILDNQKRPLNQIFLTIVNKGYSGYFNKPYQGTGVKQGWQFNITQLNNQYWDQANLKSNSSIGYSSYTLTSGSTETFYYNKEFFSGNTIPGDWCEWNNITQEERVVSPFYHKIKYNQDVFKSSDTPTTNPNGYYYQPHIGMKIREFSNYVENGKVNETDAVPFWSYYSAGYQEFFWRDLYTYGFLDEQGNGVDFPFLNFSHYPYTNSFFRLIPEGAKFSPVLGLSKNIEITVPKPVVDECE